MTLAVQVIAAIALGHGSRAPRYLMAHVMPWFQTKQFSGKWGWHWTMNTADPDKGVLAAHYHPLIGAYDSADPNVLECQVLLMKFAGIDGVLVDWYGTENLYDYADNHRNTLLLIKAVKRAGLKFAIVYEDQTVPNLIKGGIYAKKDATAKGEDLMRWVDRNWFSSPSYLAVDGRPVFLVFGPQYYEDAAWREILDAAKRHPLLFSVHYRRASSDGAFDWPLPQGGSEAGLAKQREFIGKINTPCVGIPVAFPRFHDYYREGGVHDGLGVIDDDDGRTYRTTLEAALKTNCLVVQIATWNDWGEGTSIEPSVEFGFRDLEATQRLVKRHLHRGLTYKAADLRLPVELLRLARRKPKDLRVATIRRLLYEGKVEAARQLLNR